MSDDYQRPCYVYRLIVAYPEGTEPGSGWAPDGWDPDGYHASEGHSWAWPKVRDYLSRAGAEHRARLLRSYGATVEVRRSQRVFW